MEPLKMLDFNKKIVLTSYALGKGSSLIDTRRLITTRLKYQSGTLTVHLITYTIKYSDTGRIVTNIITVDDYGHVVDRFGNIDAKPIICNKLVYTDKWYNLYHTGPGTKYYDTQEEAIEKGKCIGDDYITTKSIGIYE